MKKPVVLCIMDGFGWAPKETYGNAIVSANTPNLDKIMTSCPNTTISTSGLDVGLPDGQMGNSEVGHTNIGAGRIVYQDLTRISNSIVDGTFFENEALLLAIENCKKNNSALHLMGLLSDGGVHSHNTHLYGLLELAKKHGPSNVFVHCILDGRDVPPTAGIDYVAELEQKIAEIGIGEIATITGRFYAMDRDNRWERIKRAYNAFVKGEGEHVSNPLDAIRASYETIDADGKYLTDEFMLPAVIDCIGAHGGRIKEKDSIIFFNFRPDRAREITRAFVDPSLSTFSHEYFPVFFVCMTQYDATMPNVEIAFKPELLENTLGEYLANNNLTQLRIAETEKYAHVTFFFNGGTEVQYEGEDRILIPSPKVTTYNLKPEMSAIEVTDELVKAILSNKYDVIIINYANCDMVGHTGIFDATVKAVETVDTCLGRLIKAVNQMDGAILLTADHGNAEKMYEPDGSPFTAHTTNPVPFAVIGCGDLKLREGGKLCDLSPTILKLLNLPQPKEMTGKSLIK
ncbi:MAG: 2,3-bisphosphoglycerate-independent phosphoglycerate mutase [Ruminococcaceae bacterium]|nr:2,3-bisphosphoglycerate-independent phosphoglycerate mutase [Oscillospiraceae bacterium]